MYFLLSPAKKLAENQNYPAITQTDPKFSAQAQSLAHVLRKFAPHELAALMGMSDKLALLNAKRYADFASTVQTAYPAVFLFNGDAYEGLSARTLPADALAYLQNSLGILSGLYGLLRPFDAIYPYRLEMSTALANEYGKDLYAFWGSQINTMIARRMEKAGHSVLINLASQEYFRAVCPDKLPVRLITPVFKDYKNGQYKVISFYAKRARGLMMRFAAENALRNAEDLRNFDSEGYTFAKKLSDDQTWVFVRG